MTAQAQRGMVAAKLASLPSHRPEDNTANLRTSQNEAAEMLNVSKRTASARRLNSTNGNVRLKSADSHIKLLVVENKLIGRWTR